jgi:hypothetical protein
MTPKPRREPEKRNPAHPDQPDDPRNSPVALYGENGHEDDTPTRPLPAIPPAVDDGVRDQHRAR